MCQHKQETRKPPETVHKLCEEGLVLMKHKHYDDALSCFEQVVELDANHAEAWFRIGCCRSEIAKLDMEDCYDSHHLARDFHGVLGFYQATIDAFQKVIEIKANHTNARNSLAELFYEIGVCGLEYGVGDHQVYDNCYEPVIECFKRATEVHPDCIDAYHRIGSAYNDWMSQRIWEIEYAKEGGDFLVEYDERTFGVTDIADACIEIYQKLIQAQPDDATAYYELGEAYGSWISSQITLWEGQNFCDDHVEEMKQGKHHFLGKAIEAYRTAIEIKPDYANAYSALAKSCHWVGQFEEAIRAFRQAIVLGNIEHYNLTKTYHDLGKQKFDDGEYAEAIECYHSAIITVSKYQDLYYDLGVANDETGQYELAILWYQRARSACGDPILRYNADHYESAKHGYAHVRDSYDYPDLHYRLGKACHRMGRYQDAVEAYLVAIDSQIVIEEAYHTACDNVKWNATAIKPESKIQAYLAHHMPEPLKYPEWWDDVFKNKECASRHEPL